MELCKEIHWADAREAVQNTNPELCTIIDRISPDKKYSLIKASFKFGDYIIRNGKLQLPIKNQLLELDHTEVPQLLREKLNYTSIPLALLLNKGSEVFVIDDNRSIPLNMLYPGQLFGTFETIASILHYKIEVPWNMSAGARTLFTLPSISEQTGYKRLRLMCELPPNINLRNLSNHWLAFSHMVNNKNTNCDWQCEIIFFTKPWFTDHPNDPHWFDFERYLYKQAWQQAQYGINKTKLSLLWQLIVKKFGERHLKPSAYLIDTVKHLITIAGGSAPAFIPADNSQIIAPTATIENLLIDVYRLKKYIPTIMHPSWLLNKTLPAYYSLAFPTLFEGSPQSKYDSNTVILEIRNIKLLIDTFSKNLDVEMPVIANIRWDYFHTEDDVYNEIQSSKQLIEADPRLIPSHYSEREFCNHAPFWRGCVRITQKIN